MADRSSRLEPTVNELYDDFRDLLVSLDEAGAEFVEGTMRDTAAEQPSRRASASSRLGLP